MDRDSSPRTVDATVQDRRVRATASVRRARLRVLNGTDAGKSIEVADEGVLVGTAPPADLVLHDPSVSRRHAEVRRAPNGFVLRDLGSTNGTFLADLRVESVYLGEGAVFSVGRTEIAFTASEEGLCLPPEAPGDPLGFVAESPAMRELVAAAKKFGPTDLSVVLEGETGVGKEVLARAFHRVSRRVDRPFVVVDCGALQENLVESELFGHERGAFTGAVDARSGAFETANGGTIFLDEIGDLPRALQSKLLRAVEAREVRRLGSDRPKTIDVRVLAATNRDLGVEVAEGRFRADLFFRLSEVRLSVPPLRDRPHDIEPLARTIAAMVDPSARFRAETFDVLRTRRWPGNVRELGNTIRRAVVAAGGEPLGPEHLAPAALDSTGPAPGLAIVVDLEKPIVAARAETLQEFHRGYLGKLLERYEGDVHAVARHAGVHVTSLHRLLRHAKIRGTKA